MSGQGKKTKKRKKNEAETETPAKKRKLTLPAPTSKSKKGKKFLLPSLKKTSNQEEIDKNGKHYFQEMPKLLIGNLQKKIGLFIDDGKRNI